MEQTTETLKPRSLKTARRVGACLLGAVAVMLPIAFTTQNDVLQFTLVAVSIPLTGFALICLLGQDGKPDVDCAKRRAMEEADRERRKRWDEMDRRSEQLRRDTNQFIPGTIEWAGRHGGKFYPD